MLEIIYRLSLRRLDLQCLKKVTTPRRTRAIVRLSVVILTIMGFHWVCPTDCPSQWNQVHGRTHIHTLLAPLAAVRARSVGPGLRPGAA